MVPFQVETIPIELLINMRYHVRDGQRKQQLDLDVELPIDAQLPQSYRVAQDMHLALGFTHRRHVYVHVRTSAPGTPVKWRPRYHVLEPVQGSLLSMPRKRITIPYPGASIFPVGLLGIKFSVSRIRNRADISQHRDGSRLLYGYERNNIGRESLVNWPMNSIRAFILLSELS
ncbi:hypothetical protein M431DRAFT_540625 [Trichoderma harzianum CBS 226.95]|uniref:Uncharacterized protein n=1 Tax=Trichoderma harzianum CBS 226.95 TaxID=983964 RepID=A0A2T4A0W3_TRIHA|nr:hypothetical protein M431DRAFT_540625 [Trichoderma harzianum CBS 226.95]PTB50699.1 hypothetical protein M431DRAFT_540625 [Trichoderma harzianum CBS 226.95]